MAASPELVDSSGEPLGGRLDARVTTDRRGKFRCQGLHAGDWRVALPNHYGVESELVTVTAGEVAQQGFELTR